MGVDTRRIGRRGHAGVNLGHHGDLDARDGLVDLAVNVRAGTPPAWLRDELAAVDLARYPDDRAARAALAARHGRTPDEVLPVAGAAEAFVLVARALRPRRPVVVHPQFTEPELALRAAGHAVDRVVLEPPFTLDPALVPDDADLVVVGNPTNPTSVLHPADTLRALRRPGRTLVVDEAFADCVPGETESLAAEPGVVVIRSLTKTWGLAGLRVGYVLADVDVVEALAQAQPHWAVSAPALAACVACSTDRAQAEVDAWTQQLAADRAVLADGLDALPGVSVVRPASASFVLVRAETQRLWKPLRDKRFAVRRGDTFPGLDDYWLRIAVRDTTTTTALLTALEECL
ncbi:MAG: Rv2231c family pyridoxal phosphate-dependent protein CobC [Jatrophihabitans sp.]|uniref:Rv2231c family pyridoxal phosphate-dependent protein CobC n=1 Tax=Jatrophihabitans sp. TaxID=1932789 RepID=UPI003F8117C3